MKIINTFMLEYFKTEFLFGQKSFLRLQILSIVFYILTLYIIKTIQLREDTHTLTHTLNKLKNPLVSARGISIPTKCLT